MLVGRYNSSSELHIVRAYGRQRASLCVGKPVERAELYSSTGQGAHTRLCRRCLSQFAWILNVIPRFNDFSDVDLLTLYRAQVLLRQLGGVGNLPDWMGQVVVFKAELKENKMTLAYQGSRIFGKVSYPRVFKGWTREKVTARVQAARRERDKKARALREKREAERKRRAELQRQKERAKKEQLCIPLD